MTHDLRRRALRLLLAWAALIGLMLASLGSAYLPLGPWNLVAGIAIAAVKSLLVLAVFMGLLRAPAVLRLVAAIGFCMLGLLFVLSGVDYATRTTEPVSMQVPRQLPAVIPEGLSR